MLRDKNLVPLSRQHQRALALCVRLDRALQAREVDPQAWQSEMQQIFEGEIALHFATEEKELFPAAAKFSELQPLTQELIAEHAVLRDFFARASHRELNSLDLQSFAGKLAAHIRKEERQLFEGMQKLMSADDLAALGAKLDAALADVSQACTIPSEATRLRAKQS